VHSPVAVDATPGRLEAHQSIGRCSSPRTSLVTPGHADAAARASRSGPLHGRHSPSHDRTSARAGHGRGRVGLRQSGPVAQCTRTGGRRSGGECLLGLGVWICLTA